MNSDSRTLTELTRNEALAKLAAAPFGRVIFTQRAMPALRHVNHAIRNGLIIIRSHPDAAIAATGNGTVVLYQADDIDPVSRTGWAVTVTGMARLITDPAQAAAHRAAPRPWITGDLSTLIAITPDIITGFRLALAPARRPPSPGDRKA